MQPMHSRFASGRCRALLAVAALALAGEAAAQQVYKTVDADGHVIYSDRGASKNSATTAVNAQQADPAGAAQLAKEQRALAAADAARAKDQAAADKQHAADQKQHQQACNKARQEYERVLNTRRLYHLDAEGNRIYYPDEELDQVRDQARKSMLTACN
jgi:Skp family chaperone for outer membrane proteins